MACTDATTFTECRYEANLNIFRLFFPILFPFYFQLWKEKKKDLWILFTNWGRIGLEEGQYQNTPFGSAEQATQEFEKIFKEKTGNVWKHRDKFLAKQDKYRMVNRDHLIHVNKKDLDISLESSIESQLPDDVQGMLSDIADVSAYVDEYKQIGSDTDAVPFGRIKRESLEEAKKILEKLRVLVSQRWSLEAKRKEDDSETLNKRLFDTMSKIKDLSSEYYYLMPKAGFEYTSLPTIDSKRSLQNEFGRVEHTLQLETAERLILAAQFRKEEINPLDYIYRALKCHLRPVSPDEPVVPYLLQYLYNSSEANEFRVAAIYQIRRPEEDARFGSSIKEETPLNRRLHWHGTKTAHLLGIFSSGLLINPSGAVRSGSAFGNGIYTSNVFKKSSGYSYDYRVSGQDANYVLLCDVALGNTLVAGTMKKKIKTYPPKGFDSFSHESVQFVPDPLHTVKIDRGQLEVPLGKITQRKTKSYSWSYPEYVCYDESQVALRYVVKLCEPSKLAKVMGRKRKSAAEGCSSAKKARIDSVATGRVSKKVFGF